MASVDDTLMTAGPGRPSALSRGQGLAVWRQIADVIGGEIEAGQLRPGTQLPTEAVLAARFAVNRHTVRRALAALADDGLVRATRGSGTFVAGPITYPIRSRTRFSEIVTRTGREPMGELLSEVEVNADAALADSLGVPLDAPLLELGTVHRADGIAVSTSRTYLPLPRFAGFGPIYAESGSITRAFAAFRVDYRRRDTRIRARPATREEADTLGLEPGSVVLSVLSVNVDEDDRPVQATRAIFAAERVEFLVES